MQSDVKTYKDRKRFEQDVQRRAAVGWTVGTVTEHRPRSGIGRFIMMGGIGALVFPPKPEIMATYTRTSEEAAVAAVAEKAKARGQARFWRYLLGGTLTLLGLMGVSQAGGPQGALAFIAIGALLILWGWRTGKPPR